MFTFISALFVVAIVLVAVVVYHFATHGGRTAWGDFHFEINPPPQPA